MHRDTRSPEHGLDSVAGDTGDRFYRCRTGSLRKLSILSIQIVTIQLEAQNGEVRMLGNVPLFQ